MNKRTIYIFVVLIFVIAVILTISGGNDAVAVAQTDMTSSYYVEADGNIFVKLAKVIDDLCYYAIDIVFGGIGSLFSSFL